MVYFKFYFLGYKLYYICHFLYIFSYFENIIVTVDSGSFGSSHYMLALHMMMFYCSSE